MKNFYFLFLLTLVAACSSHKKSAITFEEIGQYEEAVQKWQAALKEDPKDKEAQAGLKHSQEMSINSRLIKVRDLRLAKDSNSALQIFKETLELEKKWNTSLDINYAQFQASEASHLWTDFKSLLSYHLSQNFPLAAARIYHDYKSLFSFRSPDELNNEWKKINVLGAKTCQKLEASEKHPFSTRFKNQYCHYFGIKKMSKADFNKILFSNLDFKFSTENINQDLQTVIVKDLVNNFNSTPWYLKTASKKISLKLNGSFDIEAEERKILQTHEYEAKEEYTEMETQYKQVTIPYQVNEQTCNNYADPSTCRDIKVTKYKTEDQIVTIPMKKFRFVKKYYQYPAIKRTRELVLSLTGDYSLAQENKKIDFFKASKLEIINHDENHPEFNLLPNKDDFTNPNQEFRNYSALLGEDFKRDLIKTWEKTFCVLPSDQSSLNISENVLACYRGQKGQELVNHWFRNHHGVSPEIAENILNGF
ncbi:MAG: hypothetical protein AB7I27_01305 [Bacteriovoracaceae bacterium]